MLAKLNSQPRELPACEPTQAACAFIVDAGQHEETDKATGKVSLKPKLYFVFQLETSRSDGKPFLMGQTFTNSLHKKANLRKFLENWEGRKFSEEECKAGIDLDSYLDKNLIITPVHNGEYANVGSVSKIRAKDKPFKPTITELPRWVHSFIAKAKVPPEGYVKPADLPF